MCYCIVMLMNAGEWYAAEADKARRLFDELQAEKDRRAPAKEIARLELDLEGARHV